MTVFNIGEIIREARMRLGLSQEELCNGVVAVSTLSRLENGNREPSRKTVDFFCQKLGIKSILFVCDMNTVEMERKKIEDECFVRINVWNFEIADLIAQYKNASPEMELLENQFYCFMQVIFDWYHGMLNEDAEKAFAEVLRMTFPEFKSGVDLTNHYFTELELILINQFAIAKHKKHAEDVTEAIDILRQMKIVYETHSFDPAIKTRLYPYILEDLINWIYQLGDIEEPYQFACEGVEFCLKTLNFARLPSHLFDKGTLTVMKGQKEEGRRIVLESFVLLRLLGQEWIIDALLPDVNKFLGDSAIKKDEVY